MVDIVDTRTRSRMMSSIRGTDTKPEQIVRRLFTASQIRYRLHAKIKLAHNGKNITVKPDLVNASRRFAVFCNGCFWHHHKGCRDATMPSSGKLDWYDKLEKNILRDQAQYESLLDAGWKVIVVWECGLKYCLDDFPDVNSLLQREEKFIEWPDNPPRSKGSAVHCIHEKLPDWPD